MTSTRRPLTSPVLRRKGVVGASVPPSPPDATEWPSGLHAKTRMALHKGMWERRVRGVLAPGALDPLIGHGDPLMFTMEEEMGWWS